MSRLLVTLLAAVLATGCVSMDDLGGTWEPVETMSVLVPEVGPAPAPHALPGCTLRVATWNVHFGEDTTGLARAIASSTEISKADVILVQEIEAYDDEVRTRTARLATELGMTWVYAPAREEDGGTHGIATLSRFPLANVAVRKLPHFDQPVRPRDRIALATDVVLGTDSLQIVNLHLDVRIGSVDRVRQLDPAVADIAPRVVVGGDFNTNPWAWTAGLVPITPTEAVAGQEQAAVIDDFLAARDLAPAIDVKTTTMRVPAFDIRTDNLYARGLPILATAVELVEGSDHWPVWFDVDVCSM